MPLLMQVANADHSMPPEAAVRAARRASKGELKRYASGHFGLYRRADVLEDEVDFLRRRVLGIHPPVTELLVEVDL